MFPRKKSQRFSSLANTSYPQTPTGQSLPAKNQSLGLSDVEVQSLSKGFCDEWSFPGRDGQLCFDHTNLFI